jgi:hypothetical protein
MTIQTQDYERCRYDGETVTILLLSTTLTLTLDEADSLYQQLESDIVQGQVNEMYGIEVSETVSIVDVPISRGEAWRLYRSLEANVFPEEYSDEEPDDEASCEPQRHDWRIEGF